MRIIIILTYSISKPSKTTSAYELQCIFVLNIQNQQQNMSCPSHCLPCLWRCMSSCRESAKLPPWTASKGSVGLALQCLQNRSKHTSKKKHKQPTDVLHPIWNSIENIFSTETAPYLERCS